MADIESEVRQVALGARHSPTCSYPERPWQGPCYCGHVEAMAALKRLGSRADFAENVLRRILETDALRPHAFDDTDGPCLRDQIYAALGKPL